APALGRRVGRAPGLVGCQADERTDRRIEPLDRGQAAFENVTRGDLTHAQLRRQCEIRSRLDRRARRVGGWIWRSPHGRSPTARPWTPNRRLGRRPVGAPNQGDVPALYRVARELAARALVYRSARRDEYLVVLRARPELGSRPKGVGVSQREERSGM